MIPPARSDRAIANRDVEVALRVHACSWRCPDASLTRGWDPVDQQRSLAIGSRSDDATDIIRAVPVQAAVGDIDHPVGESERAALLVRARVHAIGINHAAHFHLSIRDIHSYQDVCWTADLSDGKYPASRGT